jgi:hypothetical protein
MTVEAMRVLLEAMRVFIEDMSVIIEAVRIFPVCINTYFVVWLAGSWWAGGGMTGD